MTCTSVPVASPALPLSYVTLLGTYSISLGNAFKTVTWILKIYVCDFFASDNHKLSGKSQHLSVLRKKKRQRLWVKHAENVTGKQGKRKVLAEEN